MSQIERYKEPLPEEQPQVVRDDWVRIGRLARITANSKIAGKWAEDPEAIFSAYWQAHTLHMAVSVGVLRKFHNIDGVVEPAAQTRLGLMHAAGHHTRWGRHDDELAELYVRKAGEAEEERFSFTAEQARAAGLLDEWVERWIETDEVWADSGKHKKRLEKYVLGSTTDEYRPTWVQPEIDAGQVKRKQAWFAWREDMLMNRAASRACKYATPEVELGIEQAQYVPPPPPVLVAPDRPEVLTPGQYPPAEASDPSRPFE